MLKGMIRWSALLLILITQFWIIANLTYGYVPNSKPAPINWPFWLWLWPPSISRWWDILLGFTPAITIWIGHKGALAELFAITTILAAAIGIVVGITFGIYAFLFAAILIIVSWYT